MVKNSRKSSVLRRKKKIILLTAYPLLLITLLIGCAKREITNIDSSGKNIICFGDSVTYGYGAAPGEDYPTVLAGMIDIPVINAGIDGDTSIQAMKRLEPDVLDRDPLLVIIEFGGNDFLRKIPRETTIENITEMVERIQKKGAMVVVADISAGIFLTEYHSDLLKIAKDNETIFVPSILKGIITNPNMKSDFFHPNADGYKMIAHRVYREIRPYLNENILLRTNK
ncbi:MAG: arylesterase [Candidatus Omnitrophica bacterium]|nr:arylesterase [Candidatus Omnitrophota bacterium]